MGCLSTPRAQPPACSPKHLDGCAEAVAGTWVVPMAASEKALAARRGGVQGPWRRMLCEGLVPMATAGSLPSSPARSCGDAQGLGAWNCLRTATSHLSGWSDSSALPRCSHFLKASFPGASAWQTLDPGKGTFLLHARVPGLRVSYIHNGVLPVLLPREQASRKDIGRDLRGEQKTEPSRSPCTSGR